MATAGFSIRLRGSGDDVDPVTAAALERQAKNAAQEAAHKNDLSVPWTIPVVVNCADGTTRQYDVTYTGEGD